MAESINAAILERLEKVVSTLQENSMKMGQLLAVHNEKLDKQDRIDAVLFEKVDSVHREVNRRSEEIKKGCERDIRKVDDRLRLMEKKMWTIFGALSLLSFIVSPVGQRLIGPAFEPSRPRLTPVTGRAMLLEPTQDSYGDRRRVRSTSIT
tara:strand:- start:1062 stop:1514 length:453 start_codon:yes stop_codon:yes gene_type:complete